MAKARDSLKTQRVWMKSAIVERELARPKPYTLYSTPYTPKLCRENCPNSYHTELSGGAAVPRNRF